MTARTTPTTDQSRPALHRRLGVRDAVVIGLGSMVGAGVFSAFTPAAAAAGSGLLVGLVVAAVVAWCNATASAQLAAQYPTSGGTYVYRHDEMIQSLHQHDSSGCRTGLDDRLCLNYQGLMKNARSTAV